MISSFRNANYQFLLLFAEVAQLQKEIPKVFTDYNGDNFTAFIKSGNPASNDLSQATDAKYPMITVTPMRPVLRDNYKSDECPYYAALRDTDNDGVMDTISQFFEPLPMVFRYEINVFSKNPMHHEILDEWLCKRFLTNNQGMNTFVYNSALSIDTIFGQDNIGDIVGYKFRFVSEPFRTDGVEESLYEFLTYPDVYLKDPVDLPVIREIIVNSFQQSI